MNSPTMTAHATTSTRRAAALAAAPALTPLVLAMLAAFPLYSVAQGVPAVTRPVAPAAFVVPRPMPGWRVTGAGAAAPLNTPNANGGTDQVINQSSQRAIYNWQSFDIGATSSVTFNFPGKDSSSLNRVVGSPTPSQIFGVLKSQYANPDATKPPLVGGSVYLINANGILFGRNAQVNTGSLIASTLNLKDSDFLSGLSNSINGAVASFEYQGAPGLFTDSHNFVLVDPGATITTASGGRVFLFAKNVQNGGQITTPGGQTVLAAGSEVYLSNPTREPIYASEVNSAYPALRGLLVEVGRGDGSASNLAAGTIDAARGNVTLVGMSVNQSGRINATTSVSENGSVFLLARGNASAQLTGNLEPIKHATTSGALTLGSGSAIEIRPDTAPGADGQVPTSDAASVFTTSRVELAGKTIEFRPDASITAHGGVVNARAEVLPNYDPKARTAGPSSVADSFARLVLGVGATIDVSGTDSTVVSVARNFVTTELLGKSDLKDAPLQKDGPLYRSKITFDLRNSVPILGNTSSYVTAVKRTANERLSAGGSITLASTGAILTNGSSRLNVSGGAVTYTDATVVPTVLLASDGSRVTLNKAAADVVYTGIEGGGRVTADRWGIVPRWVPAQSRSGQLEPGYAEGRAGGALSIAAPLALLDGQLQASIQAGERQTSGVDRVAAAARVEIVAPNGVTTSSPAVPSDLTITRLPSTLPGTTWAAPLLAPLPSGSRIAAGTLEASGLGRLTVSTSGKLTIEDGADLALAPLAAVSLTASGAAGITLGGSFQSTGGSFSATTADVFGSPLSGALVLTAGTVIDVAGDWRNAFQDGPAGGSAYAGGSVSLSAAHGLNLQDASRIDVSGGGTVRSNGTVSGTDAGSITLKSNNVVVDAQSVPASIHLGAVLKGQSLAGGGTLWVKAADVTIGSRSIPRGVADGATPGSLAFSEAFFDNGGFTTYRIDALRTLDVLSGTRVAPRASNWLAPADARNVATGTRPASFLGETFLADAQRKPVNLQLSAGGTFALPSGELILGAGASIDADPRASVSLLAGLNLDVQGRIRAPGGNVTLSSVSASGQSLKPGLLRIGEQAVIDVSGTVISKLPDGGPPRGDVLPGGNVTIQVSGAPVTSTQVQVRPGAVIAADGTSALLATDSVAASGAVVTRMQTVASEGGSIAFTVQDGGAALAGAMHAFGGTEQVSGGRFSLTLNAAARNPLLPLPTDIFDRVVNVQEQAVTVADVVPGTVVLSATTLRNGFVDASISAPDHIIFKGNTNLTMARELVLNAPALQALPGSKVVLSGGSSVQLGGPAVRVLTTTDPTALPPATPITGSANLHVEGGVVELFDTQVLQGIGSVDLVAASELRLHTTSSLPGQLAALADVSLKAPQIAPTTGSAFMIDAPGHTVTISGGDPASARTLSAGGSVTINAATINQGGVLRAPFGHIALNATQAIRLSEASLTSVSGAGQTVPFGKTDGGANWTFNANTVATPPDKAIDLRAPGQRIDIKPGAQIDLAGGGALVAMEFVPGPGGSKDVFADATSGAFAVVPVLGSYAPQDRDIQALAGNSGSAFKLGSQITFGAGGPIPAGTYAVVPPRYATLAGAFLVRPVSSGTALELGASIARADGSTLVGGQLGSAGTPFESSLPRSFQVLPSALVQRASEVRQTDANNYFTATAAAAGTAVPRLPVDAGRLNAVADTQSLKGHFDFSLPDDVRARGGEFDISASSIRIVGSAASVPAQAGVLLLDTNELNAAGAALLVIGGARNAGDGKSVDVAASSVVIDNAGTTLKGTDIVIAAKGIVELKAGAAVKASGTAPAESLGFSGDGALLRLNGDPSATTTRTGVSRAAGDLLIGAGASLTANSIIAEATHQTGIAADAAIVAPRSLTIGASRIAVGSSDPAVIGASTLALTPELTSTIGKTESLALRSFDGIDFYGTAALGGAGLKALTLDTGSLRLASPGTRVTIAAGGVVLTNSTGSAVDAAAGNGSLDISAEAQAAGTGRILIGPGSIGIAGVASTTLNAAHDVTLGGSSQLAVGRDLALRTPGLLAATGVTASLVASGHLSIDSLGAVAPAAAGTGAHVSLVASSIAQSGNIALLSGELNLQANAAEGGDAIVFGATSRTDLTGTSRVFDGVSVATPGGDLHVAAQFGNVIARSGSLIDVSAPVGSAAHAGTVTITASGGAAILDGRLRAVAGQALASGSLSIDTAAAVDLGRLAALIAAERSVSEANFADTINVRNRLGDQTVATAGPGFAARHIAIASDAGALSVAGSLIASGDAEPSVVLAGGTALHVLAGAQIAAHGAGATGGRVSLLSGTAQGARNGLVDLRSGMVDVSAAPGGADGSVVLRAQWNDVGNELRINTIGTRVVGARKVEVEAVNRYTASVVDAALIETIDADNAVFAGNGGSNAAAILSRLAGGDAALAAKLQLRNGVEIVSAGDMQVKGDSLYGGWNLTHFGDDGRPMAQASGSPVNLTLRAAGNLMVTGSISDGFSPAGAAPPQSNYEAMQIVPAAITLTGEGSRIRLVGGADLTAANAMATASSDKSGDVIIGSANADVIVRTTTGTIEAAAGRDVTFVNRRAAIYTTGKSVADSNLPGYVGSRLAIEAYLNVGEVAQTPFRDGGGSISIKAARDVLGASGLPTQYATEWLWATGDAFRTGGAPMWYSRYDYFNQGIATFGGGNVSVQAGRDARNVEVSAATSGYVPLQADGTQSGRQVFGGGNVTLSAQRDVVSGFALATRGIDRVTAGRDVQADATVPALQLVVGETASSVEARNALDLGRVTPFGLVGVTSQFGAVGAIAVTGTAPGSSLTVLAGSGDLIYRSKASPVGQSAAHANVDGVQGNTIPDFATFAAPSGNVQLGPLIQSPATDGLLNVFAAKSISITGIVVAATSDAAQTLTLASDPAPLAPLLNAFPIGATPFDASSRSPVRIISGEGDISYSGGILVARPIRIMAGRDIVVPPGNAGAIKAQHQSTQELSLIEAGRDIVMSSLPNSTIDLRVLGPGDLVVVAGRNVDLNASGGIGTVGNRENNALPDGSAALTVVAGVAPRGLDGTQATAWYFPLLGGSGIAGHAADLAAQLGAAATGQPIPAVGGAAASRFRALTVDQQVSEAQTLCGVASFNATLLRAMQRIEANPQLDLAGANAAFGKLGAANRSGIVGAALADAWSVRIGADEQIRQALAMAAEQGAAHNHLDALAAFTSAVAGRGLSPEEALSAFAALPVERKLIFTNRVLTAEVREAGRKASNLSGVDRDAAYAKGYAAIDTVFPEVGGGGDVRMGSSQIRTLQGSDVTILAPRGGVNVGELSASSSTKSASVLGIVTAAGGDISLVVKDSVAVNQSRVFTVGQGDLLMWASEGNLDAGRGAKTVTGAPPPVFRFDANGNFVIDTSGSFTGSGIAVLDASSTLDLYAPKGEINAGDAGIKSLGNAFLGAARFVGADNLSVGGVSVGAPPPASTGGDTAGLAGAGQAASTAATRINSDDSDEEKDRKRRKRLNLILDFLGFGDGSGKP